jgi:rare lipoprotein A
MQALAGDHACVRSPAISVAVARPAAGVETPVLASYGKASYYHPDLRGHRTASGAVYHHHELTAAHRSLPFGTRLRVTNLANGRRVEVEVNDRGPFFDDRIVDLSEEAARRLGMIEEGVVRVRLEEVPNGASEVRGTGGRSRGRL